MLNGPLWNLEASYYTFGDTVLTHSVGNPMGTRFKWGPEQEKALQQI